MPGGVDGRKILRLTSRYVSTLFFAALIISGCEDTGAVDPMDAGPYEPDPPSVTVVFPNGGESLSGGVRIEWASQDPDPGETELLAVTVEVSADAGMSWTKLFMPRNNTGSLGWDVDPMEYGDDYLVRVTVIDTSGLSDSDVSDSVFSVTGGIIIEDITGLQWNITHAVTTYGMVVENWGHGIGPDAIKPINDPLFLSPGDQGYPSSTQMTQVLGVDIGGDARAYPISTMSWHEVVNDWFGDEALAVIY